MKFSRSKSGDVHLFLPIAITLIISHLYHTSSISLQNEQSESKMRLPSLLLLFAILTTQVLSQSYTLFHRFLPHHLPSTGQAIEPPWILRDIITINPTGSDSPEAESLRSADSPGANLKDDGRGWYQLSLGVLVDGEERRLVTSIPSVRRFTASMRVEDFVASIMNAAN